MALKARFIQHVGTRISLRTYWEGKCGESPYHNAMKHLLDTAKLHDDAGGDVEDHAADAFPQACDECGAAAPLDASHQVYRKRLYNTPSGEPEPGDLFFAQDYDCAERERCPYGWTNCDGKHLMAVLPNGRWWDIDSRASNCTMPKDTTHRCWVRHGEPPNVHVDKAGAPTCQAGAGSIAVPGYHGFLHNGQFTDG